MHRCDRLRAGYAVHDQSLCLLESLDRRPRLPPVEAIDRTRVVTEPAKPALKPAHSVRGAERGGQCGRRLWPNDAIRREARPELEALHGGSRQRTVEAIDWARLVSGIAQGALKLPYPR